MMLEAYDQNAFIGNKECITLNLSNKRIFAMKNICNIKRTACIMYLASNSPLLVYIYIIATIYTY